MIDLLFCILLSVPEIPPFIPTGRIIRHTSHKISLHFPTMNVRYIHIVVGWLLFAVVITLVMYLVHPSSSTEFNFISELIWETAFSLVWIPTTPMVLLLSRKYAFAGEKKLRNIFLMISIGVLCAVLLCAGHSVLVYLFNGAKKAYSMDNMLVSLYYNIDKMLIVYCVLVIYQQALTYYEEIQHKELKASQLKTQLSQAHMQALKMQLQPHFLFNTLNAIVTLIHKNPDAAEEMIVRLSDFLRMTLDVSGKQLVPLREEVEFIRAYVEIEQIRFGGKLQYVQSIPAELLDAQVPLLLLQPLVENAIKHGISQYDHAHSIELTAERKGTVLRIRVSDDGIPAALLDSAAVKQGIGLNNTRMRIETMYGENGRMDILSNGSNGVMIEMSIPFNTSSNEY